MSTEVFVNPVQNYPVYKFLFFDFPAEYHCNGGLPNVNLEAPAIEELYGKLGTPPKEQGHPCLREKYRELEDPRRPYQDQIIDIDRLTVIDHTGRLSGSFVKYLSRDDFVSIVRMDAHPLTYDGPTLQLVIPIRRSLSAGANSVNRWFWYGEDRRELILTARAEFQPRQVGLKAGQLYKLIVRWEFWDATASRAERMPISGFNEAYSFQVSEATENL